MFPQTIFIYSIIAHKPLHYENYDYPDWADGVGWCLACLSMCQIPFWALVVVLRAKGSSLKQVRGLSMLLEFEILLANLFAGPQDEFNF